MNSSSRLLRGLIRALAVGLAALVSAQTSRLAAADPNYAGGSTGWTMTFEDLFDGTTLDITKWRTLDSSVDPRYEADHVSVSGGNLRLKIDRIAGTVYAARIDSMGKFEQRYGFFECRAQIPTVQQTLFAFWLTTYPGVNTVDGTGHDGCELDVVESYNQDDSYGINLHWDGYGASHQTTGTGAPAPGIHTGFHTFGLEWDATSCKFYYDGTLKWTYTGVAVPNVSEFLILSTESGFGAGNLSSAALPYYGLVDYCRAWQRTVTPPPDPVEDSAVRDGEPNTNQAGTTATTVLVKADAAGYNREGFFKFNFSGYSGTVSSATITLTPTAAAKAGIQHQVAFVSSDAWSEGTITWATKPGSSTFLGAYTIVAGTPITINVTPQVQTAMASDKTISIRVYCSSAPASDNSVSYGSSENATASVRPVLNITSVPITVESATVRDGADAGVNQSGTTAATISVKADATGYNRESLIKFDFSGYSGTVSSAIVTLKPLNVGRSGITNQVAFVSSTAWTEGAITWNTKPGSSTVLHTYTPVAGTPVIINVTSQVQAAMATGKKIALRVLCTTAPHADNTVSYASDEATTVADRPSLSISP